MNKGIILFVLLAVFASCSNKQGREQNSDDALPLDIEDKGEASIETSEESGAKVADALYFGERVVIPNDRSVIIKYVISKDGLRVREKPDGYGKILGVLPYKTRVFVYEEGHTATIVDDIKDYWNLIKTEELEGWVFGGYLSELNPDLEIDEYIINNPKYYEYIKDKERDDHFLNFIIFNTHDLYKEITDFSAFEEHPFDIYVGNWQGVDWNGELNENMFLKINTDGQDYQFAFDYYGTTHIGKLHYLPSGAVIMLTDDLLKRYDLKKPSRDDEYNIWETAISEEESYYRFIRPYD